MKCISCNEIITNPECVYCYLKELNSWFYTQNIGNKNKINAEIKKKLIIDSIENERCLFCKQEQVNICTYCFFSLAKKVIKGFNFKSLKNFDEVFNYKIMDFGLT